MSITGGTRGSNGYGPKGVSVRQQPRRRIPTASMPGVVPPRSDSLEAPEEERTHACFTPDIELASISTYFLHGSEEARQIAQKGLTYLTLAGSQTTGTATEEGDRDEFGITFEPARYVLGTARIQLEAPSLTPTSIPFEQYEVHTAWDRGGLDEKSVVGDVDLIVYGARKWATTALSGNPTMLVSLYSHDDHVLYADESAVELRENAHRFASQLSAGRFLGYLNGQMDKAVKETKTPARPELVERHGYDTKYASTALKLAHQGVEMMTTGRITLPMPEGARERVKVMRAGEVSKADAIEEVREVSEQLARLKESNDLPERPDSTWIDGWLERGYQRAWAR